MEWSLAAGAAVLAAWDVARRWTARRDKNVQRTEEVLNAYRKELESVSARLKNVEARFGRR